MLIGMDIDGVMTEGDKTLQELANSFFGHGPVNAGEYCLETAYGCSSEDVCKFWEQNRFHYIACSKPVINLQRFAQAVYSAGHRIVVITDRLCGVKGGCDQLRLRVLTRNFLEERLFYFGQIIYSNGDKASVIRAKGVSLMYEDKPSHIREISKVCPVLFPETLYTKNLSIENATMYKSLLDTLDLPVWEN